jgi:hypothetical protein
MHCRNFQFQLIDLTSYHIFKTRNIVVAGWTNRLQRVCGNDAEREHNGRTCEDGFREQH